MNADIQSQKRGRESFSEKTPDPLLIPPGPSLAHGALKRLPRPRPDGRATDAQQTVTGQKENAQHDQRSYRQENQHVDELAENDPRGMRPDITRPDHSKHRAGEI